MTPLEKAIANRDRFLEEHPHLKAYQEFIDEILDKTPQHLRGEVLAQLGLQKSQELQAEVTKLLKEVADALG